MSIRELQRLAESLTGRPAALPHSGQPIAVVEYRDGTVLDVLYHRISRQAVLDSRKAGK